MTGQRPFPKKVTCPENRRHRLLAAVRHHGELDGSLLNVEDAVGRIALGENDRSALIGHDGLPGSRGSEKRFRVERTPLLDLHQGYTTSRTVTMPPWAAGWF
jgi:hypothetical protein